MVPHGSGQRGIRAWGRHSVTQQPTSLLLPLHLSSLFHHAGHCPCKLRYSFIPLPRSRPPPSHSYLKKIPVFFREALPQGFKQV